MFSNGGPAFPFTDCNADGTPYHQCSGMSDMRVGLLKVEGFISMEACQLAAERVVLDMDSNLHIDGIETSCAVGDAK